MKLLFQADDFGLTEGTALGIGACVKSGLVRNTGLFVNMPATDMAVELMSRHPEVCLGLDINLVAGRPVSDPGRVARLLNEDGCFLSSRQVAAKGRVTKREGLITHFEQEPYPYDEIYHEIERQVLRFRELVGKWPGYLHPHSLMTPMTHQVMREIAGAYDLKYTLDLWPRQGLAEFEMPWTAQRDFSWDVQLATDVEQEVLSRLPSLQEREAVLLICHPGYADMELFRYSSFTGIRMRDMEMARSAALRALIDRLGVKQVTYDDF